MSKQTQRRAVATEAAPAAVGPYSQGMLCGNLLFISGQLPIDPASGELIEGTIEENLKTPGWHEECGNQIPAVFHPRNS